MNPTTYILKRKLATLLLIGASLAAFATLGDGSGKRSVLHSKTLLTTKVPHNYKSFSLKTGYNYRGKNILSSVKTEGKYIQLNNAVSYQKGNATYNMPMKKKILLDKIKFNPAPVRY